MEKLEYTHNNDHVKWCYGKQFSWLLIELLYNPEIPMLDIYPKELKKTDIQKNLYTNVHSVILNSQTEETTQISINR